MKTLKCHWCVLIRLFNCHSWTVLSSVWVLFITLYNVIHTFESLHELIWFKHSKESWWSALSVVPYSITVAPTSISFEKNSLGKICWFTPASTIEIWKTVWTRLAPYSLKSEIWEIFRNKYVFNKNKLSSWNLENGLDSLPPYPLPGNWPWEKNPPICKASFEENGTGLYPIWMTQKPRKEDFRKLKSKKLLEGGGIKAPDPPKSLGLHSITVTETLNEIC